MILQILGVRPDATACFPADGMNQINGYADTGLIIADPSIAESD